MPPRVVIVGGGAGGLELATKLGDRCGKRGKAVVTLVDRSRTHLWKPLLHEVAAGSMDIHHNQLDYLAQARWHHFSFTLGTLTGIDRAARRIEIGRVADDEGREILPQRTVPYDMLVIAIGSESNDFRTPGVRDHAFMLDNAWQAHLFHRRLVNACFNANFKAAGDVIRIVIVGAGATGVELAAELHNTIRLLAAYGLENFDPATQIKLTLVEAGPRILPGLPEHVADGALHTLHDLHVDVLVNEKVIEASEHGIRTESGHEVRATFIVWAAGIKCADVLQDFGGLESNRLNQLVVKPALQTTRDDDIFAIGDCAAAPWRNGRTVPPRAQAAHQEASHILATFGRRLKGKSPLPYRYRDFGSLVSLGNYETVGQLMGFIGNKKFRVEGWIAKFFYISLYRQHIWALHGFWRMALDTLGRLIRRQVEPKVKLH